MLFVLLEQPQELGQHQPHGPGHMTAEGETVTEMIVDFRHRAGGRPQNGADFIGIGRLFQTGIETVPEFGRTPQHRCFLLSDEGHGSVISEGRGILQTAQIDFQIVKTLVILPGCQLDHLVLGNQSLNQRTAFGFAPACPLPRWAF